MTVRRSFQALLSDVGSCSSARCRIGEVDVERNGNGKDPVPWRRRQHPGSDDSHRLRWPDGDDPRDRARYGRDDEDGAKDVEHRGEHTAL
jgi:hypothetical protein